jgi:predicted transcriptional regulator
MSTTSVDLSAAVYQRLIRLAAQQGQAPEAILDQALADYERRLLSGEGWDAMNRRRAELIAKKSREALTEEERAEFERLQRISHEALERQFPRPRLTPEELAEVKKTLGLASKAPEQ